MKCVLLLSVLAAVSALGQTEASVEPRWETIITRKIKALAEELRPKLTNYTVAEIKTEHFSLINTLLTNLDKFVLICEAPSVVSTKIHNLTVIMDWASAESEESNWDNIQVVPDCPVLNGKSPLSGRLDGLRVATTLDFKITSLSTANITDIGPWQISCDKAEANLPDIDGGEDTNQALNACLLPLIQVTIPALLEEYEPELIALINGALASSGW